MAIQFRTAKGVTRLTKYPKAVLEDLAAFINPMAMKIDANATANIGLPFFKVFDINRGAWLSLLSP